MKRIGLFGGTFDPPHLGHLNIAKAAYEALNLDSFLFVPNHIPAYKLSQHNISSSEDRINMLKLLIKDEKWCELSLIEFEREGNTYTSDTLTILTKNNPDSKYYLVIGSDSYKYLGDWHDAATIFRLSEIVILLRDGDTPSSLAEYTQKYINSFNAKIHIINNDLYPVSSSDIRQSFSLGEVTSPWVNEEIAKYITSHNLYR